MSSRNWDEIVTRYQEVYLHSRYADNAKGILKLIPLIKDDPAFANVLPSTSLTALCLEVPNKEVKVCIWLEEGESGYTISIDDRWQGEKRRLKVNDTQVLSVLRDWILELSV